MAYYFYLDGVVLPITPSKLDIKYPNKNKTFELINGQEINIIKKNGLADITFSAMLPNSYYPFTNKVNNTTLNPKDNKNFFKAEYYLSIIKKLKKEQKPFNFKVIRMAGKTMLQDTNLKVTLEDFSISEEAKEGFDVVVKISLKEFFEIPKSNIKITEDGILQEVQRSSEKELFKSYTVKAGDSLWSICQRELGDGSRYNEIAILNNINNPNFIKVGEVILLE